MPYKSLAPIILLALALTACQTTETTYPTFSRPSQEPVQPSAQVTPPQNDKEMILNFCKMEPQECNCFADQLTARLAEEQWTILRAALNQQDDSPSGVSEQSIQSLDEQMKLAIEACSP